MPIIIVIIGILYIIGLVWSWKTLEDLGRMKKMNILLIGTVIIFLLTLILLVISNGKVNYPSDEIGKSIRTIMLFLFTGINLIAYLPYSVNCFMKYKNGDITKDELKMRLIRFLIVIIIVSFIEVHYIRDTQEGIIGVFEKMHK